MALNKRFSDSAPELPALLRRVLRLLEQVVPEHRGNDVSWSGPFYIPRRGQWWPTHFLLYRNELYCSVEIGWATATLVWRSDGDEVRFDGRTSLWSNLPNGADLWLEVLEQVEARLQAVIRNVEAYNARVARMLPRSCRTGRIRRRWTWPKGARRPMSKKEMAALYKAIDCGLRASPWNRLDAAGYFNVAAIAYDAVFPELRDLAPRDKYKRKADGRDGGLIELPLRDARAFERWRESKAWLGCHPWEIVFAHPHGILLSPYHKKQAWRFFLSVDTMGLYVAAARMAIALGENGVPFDLLQRDEITSAIRGDDHVEVGPFYEQLSLDELENRRPGAAARVVWNPPPVLAVLARPAWRLQGST